VSEWRHSDTCHYHEHDAEADGESMSAEISL
jgi:hypothetical protein